MDSFLDRFYEGVRRRMGDPAATKRLTKGQRLLDFATAEANIWEKVMQAAGQESVPGRTETTITVSDATEYYRLPGNFGNFLHLNLFTSKTLTILSVEDATYDDLLNDNGSFAIVTSSDEFADYVWRAGDTFTITSPASLVGTYAIGAAGTDDADNAITLSASLGGGDDTVTGTVGRAVPDKSLPYGSYRSIAENSPGPGVLVMSEQRGMLIRPEPLIDSDESWTLAYQKGPVILHHGTAQAISTSSLTGALTVATDAGEFVLKDGYYNGSLLRIYSATKHAPQTEEIVAFDADTKRFQVRHAWNPLPTGGTIKYEICPLLPSAPAHDDLYAIDVAIMNSPSRRTELWRTLDKLRRRTWDGALNYFLGNVSDRAPTRNLPIDLSESDPYDGGMY